jgi:hypothetical protein
MIAGRIQSKGFVFNIYFLIKYSFQVSIDMVAESMHKNALKMKNLLIESVKAIGEHKEEFVEEGKKAKVFSKFYNLKCYHFKGIGNFIRNGRWQKIGLRPFELIGCGKEDARLK